jgi:hypothetical protein
MNNPLLQITIDNKQEIELFELASSMASISDQYHRFLRQNKREKVKSESKLFVKKITEGSIILDLCEKAPALLPGVAPLLVEYSHFLVNTLDYLSGRSSAIPQLYRYLREDFLNFKKILEPVANITGNYLHLNINFGTVSINQTYNSVEANAAQNQCDKEIKLLQKAGESLLKENVHLRLYQARNSNLSKTTLGNLGIITEISEEPKVISFSNDKLRYQIINGEENPYNYAYIVDADITLKEGSSYFESNKDIKGYEILKLHGAVELKDLLSSN